MLGEKIRAEYIYGTDSPDPKRVGPKRLTQNIEGEIIYENQSFLTVGTKNYNTSINKAGILTGEVVLR